MVQIKTMIKDHSQSTESRVKYIIMNMPTGVMVCYACEVALDCLPSMCSR